MFVWKFASTPGTSTRCTASPVVMRIPPTGQASTHRPWPTQAPVSMIARLPSNRIAPASGQASTQVPHPTQMSARTIA